MKMLWRDVDGQLKKPHGQWKIRHAERWFEKLLGVPAGSVMLRGHPNDVVGSLREKQVR